ncbi:MAG: hypothetical protein US83_C0011G0015 [Candidatus Falkowbacteria bacterium GW2011_GWC2_38_22]|uniref:Uncharacterized protein n=1 Tax=Candidatus Falkowbacteria bacterium GW2011_GWE1_38_31 TaxID=1618638 RepID=A0A0G0JT35_9BACT|nr:MAG: hypothetical protein US73_C0009G0015 [Candidatus Falkowbacteria bacterium GW2011_GWF2_38_1205]KKQ60897.1 MAG: hypothetical protein US83_C0011G0015 [Candidatus Falkowbacteria bacterium GW2011_GWC2_38_22]KKQ63015.1 MAG: hypothetical protein US84_C0009G0015 [Candidatus Falkowbacteria bacterium GW2011_GWF1_38_22]KKQ65037.1 MAG: hypothetical protein US87_C0009G0015 [Candidatus Falkowbacteria bacterium GW2011_GWE2_38_254]KKQ69812.1 MAG: hypothetical protein US91_C0009G0015 [Candidatus Falkowb
MIGNLGEKMANYFFTKIPAFAGMTSEKNKYYAHSNWFNYPINRSNIYYKNRMVYEQRWAYWLV